LNYHKIAPKIDRAASTTIKLAKEAKEIPVIKPESREKKAVHT